MIYFIKGIEIGQKTLTIKKKVFSPYENDIIPNAYGGDGVTTGKQKAFEIAREMQSSGVYSRICIVEFDDNNDGKKTKTFDWSMTGSEQEKNKKSHAEYTAKRNALMARRKELEAEIVRIKAEMKTLDDEWYSIK